MTNNPKNKNPKIKQQSSHLQNIDNDKDSLYSIEKQMISDLGMWKPLMTDIYQKSSYQSFNNDKSFHSHSQYNSVQNDKSLISSLLSRLNDLEEKYSNLKNENNLLTNINHKIQKENQLLKDSLNQQLDNHSSLSSTHSNPSILPISHLLHTIEQLEKERNEKQDNLNEIYKWLNEYGYEWVGTNSKSNEPFNTNSSQYQNNIWFDIDNFKKSIDDLNLHLKSIIIQEKDGISSFVSFPSISICLYHDGLLVNNGPIRPYNNETTIIFIQDILEGFFPSELKTKYPEGVKINYTDSHQNYYKPSPLNLSSLLSSLPSKSIQDGKVVPIRSEVESWLQPSPIIKSSYPTFKSSCSSSTLCHLRLRFNSGEQQLLSLPPTTTLSSLHEQVKQYNLSSDFEMRTATQSLNSSLFDHSLSDLQLYPSAVIYIRDKKISNS